MKKIIDFEVLENRKLNRDMFLLTVYSEELPEIKPGQFVNIKVEGSSSTFYAGRFLFMTLILKKDYCIY